MAELLEHLTTQYDIVLIDTPALLPVTDAAILAKITGGALVVAAAGMVHRQPLADALRTLGDVDARVLGVGLNRVAHTPVATPVLAAAASSRPAGRRCRTEKIVTAVQRGTVNTRWREPPCNGVGFIVGTTR